MAFNSLLYPAPTKLSWLFSHCGDVPKYIHWPPTHTRLPAMAPALGSSVTATLAAEPPVCNMSTVSVHHITSPALEAPVRAMLGPCQHTELHLTLCSQLLTPEANSREVGSGAATMQLCEQAATLAPGIFPRHTWTAWPERSLDVQGPVTTATSEHLARSLQQGSLPTVPLFSSLN